MSSFLAISTCKHSFNKNFRNLDQSNKDIGGVDVENRRIYAYLLNENLIYKQLPVIFAHSFEFRNFKVKSPEEATVLQKMKADETVREIIPKDNSKKA